MEQLVKECEEVLLRFLPDPDNMPEGEAPTATIASAMLNRFHSDMRVAWFSELLLESQFITWYGHGTDDVVHQPQVIAPYAFDHPVEVIL